MRRDRYIWWGGVIEIDAGRYSEREEVKSKHKETDKIILPHFVNFLTAIRLNKINIWCGIPKVVSHF